ncbi:MAG TPA: UvrD-helicase domain-containing protein, partial [Desulfuromonadales bacterium]|nr:UvrD-helicase domain-containing protein [Desulfuromonadales bacterium]
MMTTLTVDAAERTAAVDPDRSFIVQAPAGSGKTELLIQRFLALLGQVEEPGRILAITFTRKAAAEMRNRLLEALEGARGEPPQEPHKRRTWDLASQALSQDRLHGWELLQNPALLAIQTIDSFNASLVRRMPWVSRFGSMPEMAEDADRLYRLAAEKLVSRLGKDLPGSVQVEMLLGHLDNRVDRLQDMLVAMLGKRDQWLRHLVGMESAEPRRLLEGGLSELVVDCLSRVNCLLPASLRDDILFCACRAAENLREDKPRPLLELGGADELPGDKIEDLPCWKGIADLLLTGRNELRKPKGVNKACGFPAGGEGKSDKERMQSLLLELEEHPDFIRQLVRVRDLPDARYPDEQWRILQALVELLPILVGELWLIFRSEGQADYAQVALNARQALGASDDPSDLLLRLDAVIDHILVDEFQDTSWLQYELLQTLTSGWQQGDGRTLFLVGDPMQSIYRFREAEVGLFLRTFRGRLGDDGPILEPLQLRTNFRSQQGVVDWVNESFSSIFPAQVDETSGAVPLSRAESVLPNLEGSACHVYPQSGRDDSAEAQTVLDIVRQARDEDPGQSIAILVRSRSHLTDILPLLLRHGIRYQAQDIDLLGERPAVSDILCLTRALLHRADRLSWLSVLRAPWCALRLADLHALVEGADRTTVPALLEDEKCIDRMDADAGVRLRRVWTILRSALERRGRVGLRSLVEGCWMALGGPVCYDAQGTEDAALAFDLLEALEEGGDLPSLELLEQRLVRLFAAPDNLADGSLQVMTIHKAKGLEFDRVILPGLGRQPRRDDSTLLRWLEHPQFGLLLAPIAARDGSDQDPIYQLIGRLEKEKHDLETSRLLYVAATRARKRLHLLGHAAENSRSELSPSPGSLLETLWPVVESSFVENAVAPEDVGRREFHVPLRRLPADWHPPEMT